MSVIQIEINGRVCQFEDDRILDLSFLERVVARDVIGGVVVSTVGLNFGLSHIGLIPEFETGLNFGLSHIGLIPEFETMVFGAGIENNQMRYVTKNRAIAGHDEVVEAIRNGTFKGFDCD